MAVARRYGVVTPEDEYEVWYGDGDGHGNGHGNNGHGASVLVCPVVTLYDYSFAPDGIGGEKEAVEWARATDVEASDEHLLHPDPYASRGAWCHALVERFEKRVDDAVAKHPGVPVVLVNHWPLRRDTFKLITVPRFVIWCGTRRTENWHRRWPVSNVVYGHVHIRRTDWVDGVRFDEVSMGYPRQWREWKDAGFGLEEMLRKILPVGEIPSGRKMKPIYRRDGPDMIDLDWDV